VEQNGILVTLKAEREPDINYNEMIDENYLTNFPLVHESMYTFVDVPPFDKID
jgi:hypothetical protein